MGRGAVLGLGLVLVCAAGARAQTAIDGRVLDPAGQPVRGIEVLLHAITESAGREIDRDTTQADGAFRLVAGDVDSRSVYFVAVTHEGQLFIGDLLRPPFPPGQEYVVRIGVNPVDLGGNAEPAAAPPAAAAADGGVAGAIVIAIALLVVGGTIAALVRRRPPARRRLIVELARIENDLAERPASTLLQQRRHELRERLHPREGR